MIHKDGKLSEGEKSNNEMIDKLIEEFNEMYFEVPCCDYEHHYNMTLSDVINNLKTFKVKECDCENDTK